MVRHRERLPVGLQQQTLQVAAVGERVRSGLVARQDRAQGGDVFHRQPQRGDLRQLLVGARGLGERHLRYGHPERLEGLVDLPHPIPLPRVRIFAPVLAQRCWFLFGFVGLGRFAVTFGRRLFYQRFRDPFHGPRSQLVLVFLSRRGLLVVVIGVRERRVLLAFFLEVKKRVHYVHAKLTTRNAETNIYTKFLTGGL